MHLLDQRLQRQAGGHHHGTPTCTVTYAGTGSHSITAAYSGNGNFSGSTSTPLTQTVDKATPSLSTVARTEVSAGGSATDTATVSGGVDPSGAVTFTLYGPKATPTAPVRARALTGPR